jgi:hypothetical protein
VPTKLIGAIHAAEEYKELKMLGLLPPLSQVTAFEYECYKTAEYAANTIEAEETAKAIKESKDGAKKGVEKFGANIAVPNRPEDDPFGWE